jgi:FMN phosphatase YigB (HAD superfamily)
MISFKSFITEETKGIGLTIFDIDETLFKTNALIRIMQDGKVVRSLDNQQYNEYKLKVISDLEEEIECFCYIATEEKYLDNNLKPFDWYKEWCLKGAKQHNLPSEYILTIEKTTPSEGS